MKIEGHGGEHSGYRRLAGQGHAKTDWYEVKTEGQAKGRKRVEAWQHGEFDKRRANDRGARADRERDRTTEGQIALRRKQQNQDRREQHRRCAVRPCRGDPEKLDHTDCDKCARSVDESR